MGIWTLLNPLNWFRRKRNGLYLKVRADLYDGDVHPVVDVEGIGPAYARQLAEVGILNTDQLLAHPAAAVAAAIDTPEKRVRAWQAMAELAVVNGIGSQYAEALARGGVDGIRDLVARDAKVISDEVNEYLDSLGTTVTGGKVSQTRVRTWQDAAETMRRRRVTVRLFGEALPPRSKQARRDAAANGHANGHVDGGRAGSVRVTTTSAPAAPKTAPTATRKAPARATPGRKATTTKTTATTTAKTAPKTTATTATNAACAAVTAAGTPCKRVSRDGSKYCASHKGYRAPAKQAATATASRAAPKAATKTAPAKPKPKTAARATTGTTATKTTANGTAKAARRVHVTHNGYRLYQKGNRFYFSKKAQAEVRKDGAEPVYELPRNREITVTPNGLPVLKSK